MTPRRVFIGYDPRQPIAYNVAAYSVVKNSSVPVSVTPLIQSQLPVKRKGLTEFTFTRYLPPWLCDYQGSALFVDADVLVLGDIAELPWDMPEALALVMHERSAINGQALPFERASVMLFNCGHFACSRLTPEYIEERSPQSFEWLKTPNSPKGAARALDPAWNHLVGYDAPRKDAKLAHFTMGIPCFDETRQDEYSREWRETLNELTRTCSWEEIMGGSVHAQHKRAQSSVPLWHLSPLPASDGKR
jgi:hypothetical protein